MPETLYRCNNLRGVQVLLAARVRTSWSSEVQTQVQSMLNWMYAKERPCSCSNSYMHLEKLQIQPRYHNSLCSTTPIPNPHTNSHILLLHLDAGDVGRAPLSSELIPETGDPAASTAAVAVGAAAVTISLALSVQVLGDAALVVPLTDVLVMPHAPVTDGKSRMLLSAAGVEPQLVACVIQMEDVSRSNTAVCLESAAMRGARRVETYCKPTAETYHRAR